MRIGILALQGAFIEHKQKLDQMEIDSFEIRQKSHLNTEMDGLILPGGESTAMNRLLTDLDLYDDLKRIIKQGLPVLGTCAGMILLAREIADQETSYLCLMDITVERNAYGRQLGSFITTGLFNGTEIPMTFIRAPYVKSHGPEIAVLSTVKGRVAAVREKNMLATAFHPELTDSKVVHSYFVKMIQGG